MAKPSLDPALSRVIRALVRLAIEDQGREAAEAASEIAALRAALGLENDFPAWKRKAEGLMKAFYRHVPKWGSMPLKVRLRLVTSAVQELGANASHRRVAIRAAELAELERASESHPRRL